MEPPKLQNGRMPRACKRGRPPKGDAKAAKTSGRGRTELHQEQDNRRYAPVPDVSVHYSNTGSIPSPRQQPPISYGRPKKPRSDIPEMHNNNLNENQMQNHPPPRYSTLQEHQQQQQQQQQQQLQPSSYSRTTQNIGYRSANVTQMLYPNMMQAPRSTASYLVPDQFSVPKQISQATTVTEQQVTGYRYNTRKSVHNLNLPLSTAPNVPNYWNTTNVSNPGTSSIPPETQRLPKSLQTKSQSKPKEKLCPELKHIATQSDLTLTEDEIKLIKAVRAKRMDPKKVSFVIENDQYTVTYNDETRVETVNTLMRASQDFKISLLTRFYTMAVQAGMPGLIPTTYPAIPYYGGDIITNNNNESTNNNNESTNNNNESTNNNNESTNNNNESTNNNNESTNNNNESTNNNNESTNNNNGSTSGQQSPILQQSLVGYAPNAQLANAANNDSTVQPEEAAPQAQTQVPQRKAPQRGNPSFPIPTVREQFNNNIRTSPSFRYPGRTQMRPNFNIPCQFMRTVQDNNHMPMGANFYPRNFAPEQFGMRWF